MADEQNQDNYGMDPAKFAPVDRPPIIPGQTGSAPGTPPLPASSGGRFTQATIPNSFQLQPDLARQEGSGAVPAIRLMPLGASGVPTANAAAKSVVVNQTGRGSAAVLFQTNGNKNSVQSVLNIVGSGVNYSGNGEVDISGGTGGFTPNLAIGDVFVTWPQADPATIVYVEDFPSGPGTLSGTLPHLGVLNWSMPVNASAPGTATLESAGPPSNGVLNLFTSTTVNDGFIITLGNPTNFATGIYQGYPLLANSGWIAHFIFKWPPFVDSTPTTNLFTKVRMYLGFCNVPGSSLSRPMDFIGLRFDTDPTAPAISDTTYHYEILQRTSTGNTQQATVVDSTIAPDNKWHRFTMRSTVQGQISFSIDGGTETMISATTQTQTGLSGQSYANGCLQIFSITRCAACQGTPVVITGFSGPQVTFNGTWPVADFTSDSLMQLETSLGAIAFGAGGTAAYYNAFTPCIIFGNDSQAAPTGKMLLIDYFMFIANPKLSTDFAQTTDPTKPRYFAPQV